MSISKERVEKRLTIFRKRMQEKRIDLAILWDPDNKYYLSGFRAISYSRPIVYLVYENKTQYIIPELEKDHAFEKAFADDIFIYHEIMESQYTDQDYLQILLRILEELPSESVLGLELNIVPAQLYQLLKEKGFTIENIGKDLIELRSVKDDEEIHWLKQAGYLSDLALEASFSHLEKGMSELEFEAHGDRKLLEIASEKYPGIEVGFENWTCSGVVRSAMPHLASSTRRFTADDIVVHSRQVWVDHYRAENERTFLIGHPTDEQRACLELAIEAQQVAMEMVKPGVRAKDVDIASYRVFEKAGYAEYVQHRVGHGLGLSEHEEPYLRFDNELILKEGMVYTIEPGIYVPGVGGFRHSDTVIVTKDSYETITTYPRKRHDMIFRC